MFREKTFRFKLFLETVSPASRRPFLAIRAADQKLIGLGLWSGK
jgi:hypothetical protein